MASDEQVRSIMAGVEGANAENERLHLRIKDLERGWENYSADLERLNVQDSRIKDLEDRVRAADTALNDMLLDMNDDAALPFGYESRIARITAALAGEKKP